MEDLDRRQKIVNAVSGMNKEDFDLSMPYWQVKAYKKDEFFNEYKNICKYLGFVLDVFSGYTSIMKNRQQKRTCSFLQMISSRPLIKAFSAS